MAKTATPKLPDIPEDESPMGPAPTATATAEVPLADQIIDLFKRDPRVALAAVEATARTPEGKKLLGIPAAAGAPTGHWARDYARDPNLRVTGGIEVSHPGSPRPLAPSYVAMYLTPTGEETSDPDLAARAPDGDLQLTEVYKHWLDVRSTGGRLEGKVRSDITTGNFTPATEYDPGL